MASRKKDGWCEIIVPPLWQGKTVEYILKEVWKTPKKLLHHYRMNKDVAVNGERLPWSTTLHNNDRFQVRFFQNEEYGVLPDNLDIEVIYEDDHLLVVNKPAGIDTHPNEPGQTGTLSNGVAFYLQKNGVETKVRHIHRLDRETSGAVIFAKHALAGAIMDRHLEKREINRTYLALVLGKFKQKKGIVNQPIGKDRHHARRRRVSPGGQKAITEYQVISYDEEQHASLVKLKLQTGRTHQIRVHMSYLDHPVVGDELYGKMMDGYTRQYLHAAKVSFPHPIMGGNISVIAPGNGLPNSIQEEITSMESKINR